MIINVRKIPSEGLKIHETLPRENIGLEDCGFAWPEPLETQVRIDKVENAVIAIVHVRMRVVASCSRCLEDVPLEQSMEFDLDYPLDEFLEEINLGEDIRQEIIMRLPLKVLCKDNCQGICADCGVNLNKEKCTCQDKNKS